MNSFKRIAVMETNRALTLIVRWPPVFGLTFIFLFSALVYFQKYDLASTPKWFLAIIMPCIYLILAKWVNKSVIIIDPEKIFVRHGPLPLFGFQTTKILSEDIQQAYVTMRRRLRSIRTLRKSAPLEYCLYSVLKNGNQVVILKGVIDKEQSLFLRDRINAYLRLDSKPLTITMHFRDQPVDFPFST